MNEATNEPETDLSDEWRHLRSAAARFWHAFTAWAKTRLQEWLELVDYDEDEPPVEESETPQDSELHGPSCARRVFGFTVLVVLALVSYFLAPPVHRVVNATVSAAVNAVTQEASPPKQDTATSSAEEWWGHSLKTVMPRENRGEGFAAVLSWLQIRRPELSLEKRLDEVDVIDSLITSEVQCMLFSTERHKEADERPLSIRATCLAGAPDSPWLIAAVGTDDLTSNGYTFAVSFNGKYYDLNVLNDDQVHKPERKTVEAGSPWLKAVDLDLDGSTEIIETWRADLNRVMHVQVHKFVPGFGWKRVMSFPDAWFGQIKIVRFRPGLAPRVLIAEGVGSERGGREIVGYLVSVYAWDKKRGTLAKMTQYFSGSEFDPLDAGGERPVVAKTLPHAIKVQLDKTLTHGRICTNAKSI